MQPNWLEDLASEAVAKIGLKPPVDALELADALGLRAFPVGPYDEGRSGDEIRFNGRAHYRDRHEYIAGCCARWLLMRRGYYASEVSSRRLARALMMPRAAFVADLETQRDLAWLTQRHTFASSTMICARLGDVGVSLRAVKRATSSSARRHASLDGAAAARESVAAAPGHAPRAYDSSAPETR